ncbi:MAG: glycyl-radical enzyme activating protein [Treponema sp.]|jgi:pyruvate formate lyase activating enzyme|nr:glycyl-radical enzyme activating protein [Treponema sp.]
MNVTHYTGNKPVTNGSTSGTVFDIRRFSVHDGSGIRTTVFLKGCPLRCRWCQNPEGFDDFLEPVWLSGVCINCGVCYNTLSARNAKEAASLLNTLPPEKTNEVMDLCPSRAHVWNGRIMSVDEVNKEVEKDRVFYTHGGGCTLSGGEPLAQPDFVLALLETMREAGIHTSIETSLFASQDMVEKVISLCDQIFADFKIVDKNKHIDATGKSNYLILENLDHLLKGEHAKKVIVRIPIIPGFTAGNKNITEIADFIHARNPDVPLELLNYNPLAAAKYPYGKIHSGDIENLKPLSAEQMEKYRAIVRERGPECIESV